MSKYIEPPKKAATAAMDKLAAAAKEAGASLITAVEEACTSAYDSVVNSITELANAAITAANGVVDKLEGLYDQVNATAKEFASSVEEAYDDIMADENGYTSGDYQGTMLKQANDTIDNLSPKQLKDMIDNPTKVSSMADDLASAGQTDLKNKILG